MKAPLKVAANLVSIVAVAALVLLPGSKYEWIEGVDPSFSASDFEDASGNRLVVVALLLGVVLSAQLFIFVRASARRQRVVAAAFVLVALVVCVVKF